MTPRVIKYSNGSIISSPGQYLTRSALSLFFQFLHALFGAVPDFRDSSTRRHVVRDTPTCCDSARVDFSGLFTISCSMSRMTSDVRTDGGLGFFKFSTDPVWRHFCTKL
ncbi:hypothetical protein GDO78_011014 [Eleutherodactylus coqui]|uniref:Uncharacterized protein n=1 Tax=Eleutherodactylus coqui TaxID=57060 RepID=A0A8J6F7P2_ELECQ|nr:hypothetical protein GDO78_011014 [Eleutherodactylus coqui]